jgi:integrase
MYTAKQITASLFEGDGYSLDDAMEDFDRFIDWKRARMSAGSTLSDASVQVDRSRWKAVSEAIVKRGESINSIDATGLSLVVAGLKGEAMHQVRVLRLLRAYYRLRRDKGLGAYNEAADVALKGTQYVDIDERTREEVPVVMVPADEALFRNSLVTRYRSSDWKNQRDLVALALMWGAGLSPGECVALTTQDLHMEADGKTVRSIAVGDHANRLPREVRLNAFSCDVVSNWLRLHPVLFPEGTTALFPRQASGREPIGYHTLLAAWKKFKSEEGLGRNTKGLMSLRNAFALRQMEGRINTTHIADAMGLSGPASVERFSQKLPARRGIPR